MIEDLYTRFVGIGSLLESIINDCLGLPPNFLKEYNNERDWDFMAAFRYFPATESEANGITEHEDGNCITFVFQDEVGGLEVRKDGEWIPVVPAEGKIVVNLADVIQVNEKILTLFPCFGMRSTYCSSITRSCAASFVLCSIISSYRSIDALSLCCMSVLPRGKGVEQQKVQECHSQSREIGRKKPLLIRLLL